MNEILCDTQMKDRNIKFVLPPILYQKACFFLLERPILVELVNMAFSIFPVKLLLKNSG